MDPQNIERRDSKKSRGGNGKNQGRGGNNSASNGSNNGKTAGGEKQRSNSQKSGKPYREIYKPPSLRSSKNRNSNSSSELPSSPTKRSNSDDSVNMPLQSKRKSPSSSNNSGYPKNAGNGATGIPSTKQNGNYTEGGVEDASMLGGNAGYSLFGNGNSSNGTSSVPSSPMISNRMQNNFHGFGLAAAKQNMYNVNAKEFQFLPIQHQQHQQQQISNFLSQFDPSLFYNTNSPILASSGCYPLKQSKSSGNMNLLLQQQQQQATAQAAALQQIQNAMALGFPMQPGNFPTGNNGGSSNQFNRLSQSKSSGNVPGSGSKPRVRFDDEEADFDDGDDFIGGQLGNYFTSLKLNGDPYGAPSSANFSRGLPFQQQQQPTKQNKNVPLSPQPVLKSSLQKSRTGFYLNLYGNQPQQQQQQLPMTCSPQNVFGYNSSPGVTGSTLRGHNYSSNLGGNQQNASIGGGAVKRSRSFGPGNHYVPRISATTLLSATTQGPAGHSVYSDFCITKWPRAVQELVTAAVTGVERIPARNWIEMVNGIFEAMLCDFRPTKKDRLASDGNRYLLGFTNASSSSNSKMSSTAGVSTAAVKDQIASAAGSSTENIESGLDIDDNEEDGEDEEDDGEDIDLTSAAVHIFLYFVQREKDRTVMESLLNTCFASFQRLSACSMSNPSSGSKPSKSQQQMMTAQTKQPSISRQWSNFLRFLSTLYSQVKLIRRQKQSQQLSGHSMDEMSFSLLALLCDSCLATLRSPQSYTAEMMGCLFTVLTSIGRDMEGTFPLKMKQLLAAVRDALLGIGPYHQQQHHQYNNNGKSANLSGSIKTSAASSSNLSPIVQKTLMQLIELHAANWQLPASAVRYYYSSVSASGGSNNSKATTIASTNTSSGSSQTQTSKSNGGNNSQNQAIGNNACSVSNGMTSPASSPSSSVSNTNDENNDLNEDADTRAITSSAIAHHTKTDSLVSEENSQEIDSLADRNL